MTIAAVLGVVASAGTIALVVLTLRLAAEAARLSVEAQRFRQLRPILLDIRAQADRTRTSVTPLRPRRLR